MRHQRRACPDSACPLVAELLARVVVIRNMEPSQRRVVIGHEVAILSHHGLPDTTRFGIDMTCTAKNPAGSADCDASETKLTKSIADWKAQRIEYTGFTMRGEDVPNSADPPQIQAEKRTWYKLGRSLFIEGEIGDLDAPPLSSDVRCDVADYVQGSRCVFPKTPMFLLDVRDSYGRLVSDAFRGDIAGTYPGPSEGRYYAGNASTRSGKRTYPLTRIQHDRAARDTNKAVAERYCAARWGPDWHTGPDGTVIECAVYPFNTTLDGAGLSPGTTEGPSFTVKPVLSPVCHAMEEALSDFLGRNHILDGDQFWVWLLE
ncbi:transporter [Amycolatopsis sp. WAC 01376]|uniref:transporter n=1 Tax=Amycolatopsis sp. WAC 01376 TaxID=2203195 RepID=UPI001F3DCF9F|nr:transporter [Amycolatopsis sp. WAC 01376]